MIDVTETPTVTETVTVTETPTNRRPRRPHRPHPWVSPGRILEACKEHPRIANAIQCRFIEMRAENLKCKPEDLETMIAEEYDRLRESECAEDEQVVSTSALKRTMNNAVKKEMYRLPVFNQGEILPLKYRIKNDIRNAITPKYGKKWRGRIEAVIDQELADYCSLMKRPDYAWAAIMKKKRHDIYAKPVGNVSAKDMKAFIAALKFQEKKKAEREARTQAKKQSQAQYAKESDEVAK
ncbi:MAG: ProQ/FINO family protein [Acidithiobacillus sp.]|nr:ProQ/FINO family protein [Acidithiobacillus sp.]